MGIGEVMMEVGVKESFKKKLVRSRVKWAGNVGRLGDETWKEEGKEMKVRKAEIVMGRLRED